MAHRPLPVPTGNRKQDRAAKSKYVNEHVDLIRTDLGLPTPQNKAKEIRSGKYTSGGKHLFGMQPVKGGFFTSEDPTTEDIPQGDFEGPFAYAEQEAANLRWVINNKNISDQEKTILENIALDIDSQIILGIDRELTYNNQVDRNNMSAEEFFGTGIDVEEENTLDSEQSKVQKVNQKVDDSSASIDSNNIPPPLPPIDLPEETAEQTAKREWLGTSRDTPAAKAFAQDDYRNEAWGDLRWEAQKRHKKLFDYNTDKEK